MDEEGNPLERDHSLYVVLPGGQEKSAMVHGSKPVMDLLVTLCASYHLNPSDYTVEVVSPNKNNISFTPNSPIGSLEAERIVLKPRGAEEKIRTPYMPEATVRLLINYNKAHKAVVRVNPRVPLELLLPLVCDKCEFQVDTTVLLRDSQSTEPLDLTKTLIEHGLREVFAKDSAAKEPADRSKTPEAEIISPPSLQDLPKKESRQKENPGFLSLFRRKKKSPELDGAASAPASPAANKPMALSVNVQDASSSNTGDTPKKRRAPQPPMGVSLSVPNNLSTCHLRVPQPSTLRRTKRRAPPPPCANSHQEQQADTQLTGPVDPLNTLEELRESDESDSLNPSLSSSSSPNPSRTLPSSSSSRPSFEPCLPSFRGKDFSEARSALAKVLSSSVSKGTLVKHWRNSATLPKIHRSSSILTQRFPDNGLFRIELQSVLKSRLPTEPQWEDPLQRKGMTTFKVVPLNKQKSHEPETPLDVPDHHQVTVGNDPESEAPPEAENNQSEHEDDSYSPHGSDTGTPLQRQELSSQEASDALDSPPPAQEPSEAPDSPSQEAPDALDSPPPAQEPSEAPDSPSQEASDALDSPPPAQEPSEAPDSPSQEASDALDSPPPAQEPSEAPDSPSQEASDALDSPPPAREPSDALDSPPPDQEASEAPDSPPPAQEVSDAPDSPPPAQEVSDAPDSPSQEASDPPGSPPPAQEPPDAPDSPSQEASDPPDSPPPGQELSGSPDSPPPDQEASDAPDSPAQEPSGASDSPPPDQEALNAPDSPPPPPELDDQKSTVSPLSEVEGNDERPTEEEEEEPEVVFEVTAATESDKVTSDDQINSDNESEDLQSPGRGSVSTNVDQWVSCTDETEEEDVFPPPPPPVFFNEDLEVLEEEQEDATTSSPSQPSSPACNGETVFSEDHRDDSDAPEPSDKMGAAPSRFAQAVALAVQRSRLESHGKALDSQDPSDQHSALPSAPRSTYQYGA
ncbi:cordon-bleu protein-like 1 [Hippoglossus hippoglossus]|uniref:cordon-bleu protein-like 1 n=1 Tax=Hippoglossus hippoglossus TaxID=8267 RepID=UPI00148D2529|nr:cordon-bleu protein-like 1 [Hippoglossus hippoglossus]XP_034462286.1 cordon-bleu protein-like 1 [Hippoglossus hippoglossus]XP_034462295.1 cordon-bleu protein-like 1 [Hippoglossus hippoglossus]